MDHHNAANLSRRVPTDDDAEMAVIGAVLLSRHGLPTVEGLVSADDSYDLTRGRVFEAARQLSDIGGWTAPVSSLNVRAAAMSVLVDLSISTLVDLARGAPTYTPARWARRVASAARDRQALRVLVDVVEDMWAGKGVDEVRAAVLEAVT